MTLYVEAPAGNSKDDNNMELIDLKDPLEQIKEGTKLVIKSTTTEDKDADLIDTSEKSKKVYKKPLTKAV